MKESTRLNDLVNHVMFCFRFRGLWEQLWILFPYQREQERYYDCDQQAGRNAGVLWARGGRGRLGYICWEGIDMSHVDYVASSLVSRVFVRYGRDPGFDLWSGYVPFPPLWQLVASVGVYSTWPDRDSNTVQALNQLSCLLEMTE